MELIILSIAWQLLTLWIFIIGFIHPHKFDNIARPTIFLIGVGLILRIIPAFLLVPGSNYDIESYRLVSNHVLALEDVYAAGDTISRHPYLPLQMYWMGFSRFLENSLSLPFSSTVRLAPIIADVFVSMVIFLVTRRQDNGYPALWAGFLYAANPITVYVSAYHGQFDAIPVLLILLAIILAKKQEAFLSGICIGLGILVKSWPVLAFPSLLLSFPKAVSRIKYLTSALIVPVLGVLIYSWLFNGQITSVVGRAVSYNHGTGVWGYTYLLRLIGLFWPENLVWIYSLFQAGKYITISILVLVWCLIARKQTLPQGMLTILVFLLAFFHAFSIQYLVWIIPFAILDNQHRWMIIYTLAAFSYMFLTYNTLILQQVITNLMPLPQADISLIIPTGLVVWVVTLAWAWERSYVLRRRVNPG